MLAQINNYVLKDGDVLFLEHTIVDEYNGNYFVEVQSDEDGVLSVTTKKEDEFHIPTDSIKFLRTCEQWWSVKAVYCSMEDLAVHGTITYDLEALTPNHSTQMDFLYSCVP